jgi:hypothetical protein
MPTWWIFGVGVAVEDEIAGSKLGFVHSCGGVAWY